MSRDGGALTGSEVVEAQKDVEHAYSAFIDGDYARALVAARAALDLYAEAPGQLVREGALRDLRYKALVIAARSAEVRGAAPDAFAFMAEVIRSFPGRPVTSADFDPKVGALYHRVKDELDRQGTGSLEIKVDDPAVTAFVDEQFAGAGATLDKLVPGRWRVYSAKGASQGRVHDVEIAPGGAASVSISWRIDSALRPSGAGVALDLDEAAGTETEVQSAIEIARAVGAKTVVVLSVRPINGKRAIVGYGVDVASQTRVFGAVQVEPISPSRETLAQLAGLLAGDKNAEQAGLITTEPARAASRDGLTGPIASLETDESRWYHDRLAWLITGAGVVVVGGGGFAELRASSLDDQATQQTSQTERARLQDDASSDRKLGEVLVIAGGVALAAGIFKLMVVPSRPHSAITASRSTVSIDFTPAWIGMRVRF